MPRHHFTGVLKREKELARHERAEAKREKRRQQSPDGPVDPIGQPGPEARFLDAFPDAPEAYDGIARTLSRGL